MGIFAAAAAFCCLTLAPAAVIASKSVCACVSVCVGYDLIADK